MDRDANQLARSLRTVAPDRSARRLAVIGGGWAGLAAAVEATRRGYRVTVYEMAPHWGGRSRGVSLSGETLDNGQHILIGAYVETLALMRALGVDVEAVLLRLPLVLAYPDGHGLRLGSGPAALAFAMAVWRQRSWTRGDRLALLAAAAGWAASGFRCDPELTVARLARRLPRAVRAELIEPLCVAALNTPAEEASGRVFLRVLRDALFAAPGSSDLLLPRASLSALLPDPATAWLAGHGAELCLRRRVENLTTSNARWWVDGEGFDRVIVAAPPQEAARLVAAVSPEWARTATALRYEPIVTVYLRATGARLATPMLALRGHAEAPAQFVFDRGQLGGPPGLLAFVVSGAQTWVERGADALLSATVRQAEVELGMRLEPVKTLIEKRATFRCTPGLRRPPMRMGAGLNAAGDHVDGPYPATLEGAVRSGLDAVRHLD